MPNRPKTLGELPFHVAVKKVIAYIRRLRSSLTIDTSSTTALLVEADGTKDNVLVVDTTNGRVGVNAQPDKALHVQDNTTNRGLYLDQFYSAAGNGPLVFMRRSDSDTLGTHSIVADTDVLGVIAAAGSDGTAFRTAAYIQFLVDGTPGASDMPGKIVFATTPDGTATAVARMSILPAGPVQTHSGRIVNTTRVTTTYQILVTNHVVYCDTDGGVFTATLPAGAEGQHIKVINCGSSGNTLTLEGSGAETVYGALNQAVTDGDVLDLHYNATEGWW